MTLRLTNLIYVYDKYTDHAYFPGLVFPAFQNYRTRSWYLPDVQTTVQSNMLAVAIYGFPNNNYWANRCRHHATAVWVARKPVTDRFSFSCELSF